MGPTDPPPAFDYEAYLDTLVRLNHNFIRLWTWDLTRYEYKGDSGPRYAAPFPWPRIGPGEALDGKPRFDLSKLDQSYFDRLRARVVAAGERGIYVSVMLFEGHGVQHSLAPWRWDGHPFNVANNINGVNGDPDGDGKGIEVCTLAVPEVTRAQEAYVTRVLETLNDLDNVLYEIANEAGPHSTDWQYHMVRFIHEYESGKPKQHPVGMTFQYQGGSNETLFGSPAEWVSPNPDGGWRDDPPPGDGRKVVLSDTDHLWGIGGNQAWVWKSFLSGLNPIFMDPYLEIGLFTPAHPQGALDPKWDPVRRSMGYTRRFAERMDLVRMAPAPDMASTGYCLANPGREYLVYLPKGGEATVDLSAAAGPLAVEWFDPTRGATIRAPQATAGARTALTAPFEGDAVLYVRAVRGEEAAVAPEALTFVTPSAIPDDFRLSVSPKGRYLVDQRGEPFFWLGDTGWALFSTLTVEEAEKYLENRRQKGFNVVQCIIAHWSRGYFRASPDGHKPWLNDDPTTPDEAYFQRVDAILEIARQKGIVLGLLPAWGDLVVDRKTVTTANARAYGKWLGSRYRDVPNIVWILGGDQPPTGVEDVYRELAAGLDEGDGGRHLMTYHPRGGQQSSQFWHTEAWLDLNMMQSGHGFDLANYQRVLEDYARRPAKPTVDGEPRYENIINGLRKEGPRITAHQVRKAAYNAVLSGAAGHTYGCNGVFQFWVPDGEATWQPGIPWTEAIDLPGAFNMGLLKALMLARPWHELAPDPGLVVGGQGAGGHYVPAARSVGGDFAYLYVPEGQTVAANLARMGGEALDACWFNPRQGDYMAAGRFPAEGVVSFAPPPGDPDPDYVLVLASTGPERKPPDVVAAIALRDPERVVVLFSEPLDGKTATDVANYGLDRGVKVEGAVLSADGTSVWLRTSALADGGKYTLSVKGVADRASVPNVMAGTQTRELTFVAEPAVDREALQALYTFGEGQGATVGDTSGSKQPTPLRITDETAVEWTEGGLRVTKPTLIASEGPAAALADACQAAQAITLEAWVRPASADQDGPARIVTLSASPGERDFTLGQSRTAYIARLRTTVTGANGVPDVGAPDTLRAGEPAHVVYVRGESGLATIYVDGVEAVVSAVGGDLSNWSQEFRLALANELTSDRPWLGEYRLVAIYSRALSRAAVLEHFLAGSEAK